MAEQEYYVGSVGPLVYKDTDAYPDTEPLRAFRGTQILLDNAPSSPNEVVRLTDIVAGAIAWPIGSIFISVVATNPSVLLGYGTWVAFGIGRVLVGINAADTDFDVVEETGGAKTHKHTVDPPSTTSGPGGM